jgi:hypothetical protein
MGYVICAGERAQVASRPVALPRPAGRGAYLPAFHSQRHAVSDMEGLHHEKNISGLDFGDDTGIKWLRLVSGASRS